MQKKKRGESLENWDKVPKREGGDEIQCTNKELSLRTGTASSCIAGGKAEHMGQTWVRWNIFCWGDQVLLCR